MNHKDKNKKERRRSTSSSSSSLLNRESKSPDDQKKKRSNRKKHTVSEESRRRKSDDGKRSNRPRNRSRDYDNQDYRRDRRDDNYRHNAYNRNRSRDYNNQDYRRDRRDDNYRNRRERSRSRSFDHANAKWGKDGDKTNKDKDKETKKEKPNFGLSGKLTEETNTYRGVVIKYSEPPEARKPKRRWRLYPFKGEKTLQTLYIHRESAYLIGRDRKVVDIPVDHPSCSKQHAALQYRLVTFTREDGTSGKRVRPYIIDLESANGTFINNKKIDSKKFVELLEKDVIKFGFSSREYVLLHENSKDEAQDDDVKPEEEDDKAVVKVEPVE